MNLLDEQLFVCRKFIPITRHEKCNCALVSLLPFYEYNHPSTWSELVSIVAQNDIETLKRHLDDNTNIRIVDRHGNSPLHLSVIFNKMEIFDYLLSIEKVNVDIHNRYGQTALHLAVINNSEYVITQLIKKGADINKSDESCCTPLHVAATRFCPKLIEILLDHGADIDLQNLLGRTALYHACQYGTIESVYMLLYYGANVRITDVYGVLPLTAAMQHSMNCFDWDKVPKCHTECHEVLFNYTFEKERICVNLSILTAALKINSPLFPDIFKKVSDVKYSRFDLSDFCRSAIVYKPDYFKMFLRKYVHIVQDMLRSPHDLHWRVNMGENVDDTIIKLMDFMTLLFEYRTSLNFVKGSIGFGYFISTLVILYKEGRLSKPILNQMVYFLYSRGLPCELAHLVTIYENLGFCDLVKFLLDVDLIVTYDIPKAVMPYLLYDTNVTIDKFIDHVRRPCKEYRSALKFFAKPKVRNFFSVDVGSRKALRKVPDVPCLIELARDVARKHIIDRFEVKRARDFYRLMKKVDISETYKKILTYERELYRI